MEQRPILELPSSEAAMWRAVQARDRSADGLFVFGVTSTGVYCRPGCPARRARRENVRFFADGQAARRAGLRACKRCLPDAPAGARLELCNALLAIVDARPTTRWSDAALRAAGFEPVQVRRAFLAQFGHTFHAHLRALRVARARRQLAAGRSLSEAGTKAGYESESGLRAALRAVLDVTPTQAAGRATLLVTRLASPLGALTAAANDSGLCLLEFDESGSSERVRARLQQLAQALNATPMVGTNALLQRLAGQLDEWFSGRRREFEIACLPTGSAFELEVWRRLGSIEYGTTTSYGELARELGRPQAARAVGRANSRNPIAILVPCHRVIAGSGALTGYAGGLDRKHWLLEHERRVGRA